MPAAAGGDLEEVAMVLPFLQVAVAIGLMSHEGRKSSHILALSLFLIFLLVQATAKFRGLAIPCGCFGPRFELSHSNYSMYLVVALCVVSLVRQVIFTRNPLTR